MNKSPNEIMAELNLKFSSNFEKWNDLEDNRLNKSFIGLRCISAIGEILSERKKSNHHQICCSIFDEIFSDGISSIYLASNALDKPAQIILRRVLELGLASIYLWDMPHMALSWQKHDLDLSFTEMLKHINSQGYISYVNNENESSVSSEIMPTARAQSICDVVHGKIATFETSMTNRFQFTEKNWNKFMGTTEEIIEMILKSLFLRFDIKEETFLKIPLGRKEFN
jgi:hypothetical protein